MYTHGHKSGRKYIVEKEEWRINAYNFMLQKVYSIGARLHYCETHKRLCEVAGMCGKKVL